MRALGIYRELQNSPNRESDDALILKAAMDQLSLLKVETALVEPEAWDAMSPEGWDLLVPMCESYPRLMRLKEIASRPGAPTIVNAPEAVLSCYRTAMLEKFWQTPNLLVPETEIRKTATALATPLPAWAGSGTWIKRGDVHNTCLHDVVFARTVDEAEAVRRDFASREIHHLLFQRHTDGDLIKFYGVGPGQWFTWFYHDPQSARRLPFELEDLAAQAELAAKAMGLEVFGGDAIVTPDGPIFVIDINSWPSFARVRAEAAVQIARRLKARLRERAPEAS